MTRFEFGDIVLLPFPFTDQSASKKRPAAVISNGAYNSARPDIVVAAVTSQIGAPLAGDTRIAGWQATGLAKASVVKPVFATVHRRLVITTLGRLSTADGDAVRRMIADTLG
ncbi:MAG TPA: type II toxin-antitoxin system PemK/MazF family toxin [Rhizomicrobium sp.]|jgi:mRNA interferase MazF|nr:type II toxin-antitoxin system PemK/MazF family toxin [Rhizomicrobium sp.]